MEITSQQAQVINELKQQIIHSGYGRYDLFTTSVGGYAGTGKTTLICELRKQLPQEIPVAFVTFTGKASSVLKKKLIENNALYGNDYVGTIHGLIYKPKTRWDKKLKTYVIIGWKKKDKDEVNQNIIIIDEASMVSKKLWSDLHYYEKPIIAVGDHGQLPPIGDGGFNIISDPDYKLTEIHRQSFNSPIIKLSAFIRKEGYIPEAFFSSEVFKIDWEHPWCKKLWENKIDFNDENMVTLCGFNTTRANLNDKIRNQIGFKEKAPYPNEKIVCLANNHYAQIMNGQIGKVLWLMPTDDGYRITVEIDGDIHERLVSDTCFGQVQYTIYGKNPKLDKIRETATLEGFDVVDFFDYGYVISVHKSQGSEWDKVLLFEQRTQRWSDEYYTKWLYTAVTRAKRKLMIISNAWI